MTHYFCICWSLPLQPFLTTPFRSLAFALHIILSWKFPGSSKKMYCSRSLCLSHTIVLYYMSQYLNKNETINSGLFKVNNCVFLISMSLVCRNSTCCQKFTVKYETCLKICNIVDYVLPQDGLKIPYWYTLFICILMCYTISSPFSQLVKIMKQVNSDFVRYQ